MNDECPIWKTEADLIETKGDLRTFVSNRAGGQFEITGSAIASMNNSFPGWKKVSLTESIFLANLQDSIPLIDTSILHNLRPPRKLTVSNLFDRFFRALSEEYPDIGQTFNDREAFSEGKMDFFLAAINAPENDRARNAKTVSMLLKTAFDRSMVENVDLDGTRANTRITARGWEHIESLGLSIGTGDQIFVAMWFGSSELRDFYNNGIKPAVEGAGYKCVRIDDTEHNRKIDDQIIAEIRKSKALIADITCGLSRPEGGWGKSEIVGAPRGGVYFEAGFAAGINIPVIWTVKQSVADIENVTHFDVRQFNQIRWDEDHPEFVRRLKNRIEATIGRGTR